MSSLCGGPGKEVSVWNNPMKLLFDQNISYKLVNRLADIYPGSKHVRQVGLGESDDLAVWDYAKGNDFVIVSKDEDFHQRSFLYGSPPKVVWLRLGNCTTQDIIGLLSEICGRFRAVFHKSTCRKSFHSRANGLWALW